jgi:hypothetical protein
MKKRFALWLLPAALAAGELRAETTTPGKTDLVSDMQKTYTSDNQDKEAQRIRQLQDVTGQEWLELSLAHRADHTLAAMYALQSHGVPMRRSLNDYGNALERMLVKRPDLYESQITDILAMVIREKEPDAVPALDQYQVKKEKK